MKKLYDNGYIIQKAKTKGYCGIDGDNWYLNYCSENPYFEQFYDNNIGLGWEKVDFVECCTDLNYIQQYIEESKKLAIEYRVLLCSTNRSEPLLINKLDKEEKVLGFDCAYSGGSYYSCIVNDIISGRIEEFHSICLNENNLFSTYEEAVAFLQYRREIEAEMPEGSFEKGDFIIYKISEIKI